MGRLGRPHGLDGFLGLYTDEADLIHFEPGSIVRVAGVPLTVREIRRGDKGPQVAFEGIPDRHRAEAIRGAEVAVERRRHLDPDEYWPADLVGLKVVSTEGAPLGVVTGVVHGPAQDRLLVSGETDFEIPFVSDLVPEVDVEGGVVVIVALPGLSAPPD